MNPSPVDLTTVASVKSWVSAYGQGTQLKSDDQNIQLAITDFSRYALKYTGRGNPDWQTTGQSPFNQVMTFDELYDGNGNDQKFLDQFPILSVTSVAVNGAMVPASTGPLAPGWLINKDKKSLNIRGFYNRFSPCRGGFARGRQNVEVVYSAGFAARSVASEIRTVPGTPGSWAAGANVGLNQVIYDGVNVQQCVKAGVAGNSAPLWQTVIGEQTLDNRATWECIGPLSQYYIIAAAQAPVLVDATISYFSNGNPFAAVTIAPTAGQFFIMSPGVYLFAAADAGDQVVLSYTAAGTPEDLQLKATQAVATTLIRRKHWDLKSETVAQIGTTTYRDWELAPEIVRCLDFYKRWH